MQNIFKTIKRKIYNIIWKIQSWYFHKSPIYINLNIWNCYKDYWKARKIFYPPHIVKYVLTKPDDYVGTDYFCCETLDADYIKNKWFYINCIELGTKSKYRNLEFEWVPRIAIKWQGKLYIYGLEAPLIERYSNGSIYTNNHLYWEGIVQYLYQFNRNIIKTYNNNLWSRPLWDYKNADGEIYHVPITILEALKPTKERDKLIYEINKQAVNLQIKKDNEEGK